MIRHPRQTAFHAGPHHWVVARAGRHGTWDVIEVTATASRTHTHFWRRIDAEVLAEAIAATRTHNLTSEDHR